MLILCINILPQGVQLPIYCAYGFCVYIFTDI